MKRSRTLAIVLMGASSLALSACDNSQEVGIFETVDECSRTDGFSRQQCEANWRLAEQEHIRAAPKYATIADCEADFGAEQCQIAPQQTAAGGSVFMPLMMGYMMGSMLARNAAASQPLYRAGDDRANFRTADNRQVAGRTGLARVPARIAQVPTTKTATVSRGGFGAQAARFGGAGGSSGG